MTETKKEKKTFEELFPTAERVGLLKTLINGQKVWLANCCLDKQRVKEFADATEMLWVVLANVSGSDWALQTKEWQEAAAKWRDNYFNTLKELGLNDEST